MPVASRRGEGFDRAGDRLYGHVNTRHECGFVLTVPLEAVAARHTAAVGYLWENDISPRNTPLWECFGFVTDGAITSAVTSTHPLDARIALSFDDTPLELSMDESYTVSTAELGGLRRTDEWRNIDRRTERPRRAVTVHAQP
ncbi:DUF7351 domain-containing protein [Halovivax limisalsi]|uniref:DUF7351 domain-containing protein n=1 Tax=Halovivax limisalsi TaxID=1453760 RepID=UPI001FFDB52D|nr:hypothetical protein [Halovivax limisalsi]